LHRSQTLHRLSVTTLGVVVAILIPLGPVAAQAPYDEAALAQPADADLAANATLTTSDAPPAAPELMRFETIIDEVEAVLETMPEDEWVVSAVAQSMAGDTEAAFEFLRDHIGFDPYPGILRSPQGTLAARAGNSWDRALLLQAILADSEQQTRITIGELDEDTKRTLLDRATGGATIPLDDPDATLVMLFDTDAMSTRARRDHALLVEALGDSYETLGLEATEETSEAVEQHAWLQVEMADGSWLDLDPSLADTVPGDTLSSALETVDEVPAEMRQQVIIRLIADSTVEGESRESVVLEETLDASLAADVDIWLMFAPENEGLGGALAGALGESDSWVPLLFMHGDSRKGSPFALSGDTGDGGEDVLSSAFGDALGGEDGGTGLTGLRLQLETSAPGFEPLIAERTLLAEMPDAGTPPEMLSAHHLLVSNGGLDLRRLAIARAAVTYLANDIIVEPDTAVEYRLVDQLLPFSVADRTLASISERVITPGLTGSADARGFVARPRVWVISNNVDVEDGTIDSSIDLALDHVSIAAGADPDAADAARQRLWYGVLQTALETQTALRRARGLDDGSRVIDSVSLAMPAKLEVLGPDAAAGAPESSSLAAAITAGDIAITVGDYGRSGSFWTVDPIGGTTRSVQEPGLRPSRFGGSYPGGGGGRYELLPGNRSRRLGGPQRSGGGGTEYQIVQGIGTVAAVATAFGVGWAIGRLMANTLDWIYSD